jgi:hypothetical protein
LLTGQVISPELASAVGLQARVLEYDNSRYVDPVSGMQGWHQQILQAPFVTAAIKRYEHLGSYFGVEARNPLQSGIIGEYLEPII